MEDRKVAKSVISFCSNHLWTRFCSFFSNQTVHTPCSACLPLPFPKSSWAENKSSRIYDVLEGLIGQILLNLHNVDESLQFWQCRAQDSNSRKVYFIICERGPQAFIDGTTRLLHESLSKDHTMQTICQYASSYISERVAVLSILRRSLATFLAEVYMEVEKCGEELVNNPGKSLPSFSTAINGLIVDLEASIGHIHAYRQTDSSVDGSYSMPLLFEKLPEPNQEGTNWTDCEIADVAKLVNRNLQKLDSYISLIVAKHQKPKKVTQYWIRYTCGTIGLSVCSMWLLRHSSLMGSSDIDNWIRGAKDWTLSFFNELVEQPLLSIRDELLATFRKRQEGIMEIEQVQLTADSLHRMLLEFCEENGQKLPENASDQKMLEIVMNRYEKEFMHPIQNLVSGELGRALSIQVEKITLDSMKLMLKLDQLMKANEINFAVLAVLPTFFLSHILLMVIRAVFKRDTKAEGRGRIARRQRRLILAEIEREITKYQILIDQGLEKESHFMFGLVLYHLDRLSHAVEWHAQKTGEWQCLMQDITELGTPSLQTDYKLIVTSRLNVYECLGPPSFTRNLTFPDKIIGLNSSTNLNLKEVS
ncbi:dgd1 suppressor 1 [Euphorbia peplus]|nr:dgd1 suppressor 1 [Euphorbia peplus]